MKKQYLIFIMSKEAVLGRINKYLLFLAVGLVPLFFLPFAQNVLDFPKRFLVLVLVVLSLIAWLIKQKLGGRLKLRKIHKGWSWTVGLVSGCFTLSLVFSQWPGLSFWGMPYSVSDSLLSLLVLIGLAFLILNSLEKEQYLGLMHLLIGGSALVGLFAVLGLYGASLGIGADTLVGSFSNAAVFAAVLVPLVLALLFHTEKGRIWLGISAVVLLLLVVLIDFKAAWLVLILGILVSLFFSTWNSGEEMNLKWVAALMFCLALGLFFFLFEASLPGFPTRPVEVSLSLSSEYNVVRGVFQEGIKNKILGSGPGTFTFEYSQHRSPLLNRTVFWGTRFRQGSSAFWDWVVSKGILGGLALISLWGVVLVTGFRRVLRSESNRWWGVKLGILSSLTALIGAYFLQSFSFSLLFLFWVLLGLLGALIYPDFKRISLDSTVINATYSLTLLLVIVLGVGLIFLQGVRYYASSQYQTGIRLSRQGKVKQAIGHLSTAVQLNNSLFSAPIDVYYRDLGQLYLRQANQVAADKNRINPGLVQVSVSNGVRALNKATEIAPFNPANWNVKGFFYRNLIGVKQAGNLALKSYRKAAELEPSSPFAYTEMARVDILMAQQETKNEKEAYRDAIESLEKALDKKPDYAPAHYLRAVVYDQQGKLEQAIDNLEKAERTAGRDLGLTFQLGLLYWRNGNVNQAQNQFERAVEMEPDYSNAHYMLGLAYDKQGQQQKAEQQFKKVAELNPDNRRVNDILENLKQGKSALKGMRTGTTTAPLQGTPQEIRK